MRFLRIVAKVLGWLLTPLVAWAASSVGAWVGALVAGRLRGATAGLVSATAGAVLFAVAALWLWVRLLRYSPHLREVLDVTEEGVPTTVAELGDHESK